MNSVFLTNEINDALWYKDTESLKQVVSQSKSDGNYSSVNLKLCDYKLDFLSVLAPLKQFDYLWSTEEFLAAILQNSVLRNWAIKNKAYCLHESIVTGSILHTDVSRLELAVAVLISKPRTNRDLWRYAYGLVVAAHLLQHGFLLRKTLIYYSIANQKEVFWTKPTTSVLDYNRFVHTLSFFYGNTTRGAVQLSKRISLRHGKRLVVDDLFKTAIGLSSLQLPHLIVCILCQAAQDTLGNCIPWTWIDTTVKIVKNE